MRGPGGHRLAGRGAGSARVGGCARNPVVGHRFSAGGAIPASAVAGRALHHTHRRALGRGHREGPLVSGRPRPRPRRHPHLPALPDRRRGHSRSGRPARSPCPTDVDLRKIVAADGRRDADRRAGHGYGSPTGGPPPCGAPEDRSGCTAIGRPRRRGDRARHRIDRSAGARHRRLRGRRRRARAAIPARGRAGPVACPRGERRA